MSIVQATIVARFLDMKHSVAEGVLLVEDRVQSQATSVARQVVVTSRHVRHLAREARCCMSSINLTAASQASSRCTPTGFTNARKNVPDFQHCLLGELSCKWHTELRIQPAAVDAFFVPLMLLVSVWYRGAVPRPSISSIRRNLPEWFPSAKEPGSRD